jgi:hypothetical protein
VKILTEAPATTGVFLCGTEILLLPGRLGLPIIGETISFLRDSNFADKRHKQYGPVFKTHLFGRPTVMMLGAEANRFLLTSENQYFTMLKLVAQSLGIPIPVAAAISHCINSHASVTQSISELVPSHQQIHFSIHAVQALDGVGNSSHSDLKKRI